MDSERQSDVPNEYYLKFPEWIVSNKELPYMFELDGVADYCRLEFVIPKKYISFTDNEDHVTIKEEFFDEYSGIVRASLDLCSSSNEMWLSSRFSRTHGNPIILYRPWFPWQRCKLKSNQKVEKYPQNGWLKSIWLCLRYGLSITIFKDGKFRFDVNYKWIQK